ncbi:MAG: T9SS type A sorting domain-containing protein [Sphingobacteriaceae bacterium]|nr:T9SS type A sorting domain-containing protein [Sphingobacteriaceae bacterium]
MRFLSLLILWLFSSLSPAKAQEPVGTGIARFGLLQLGEGVRIDVTLQAGFTCNGIQLLRSADSLQFETIGLIGGVCGSEAEEVSYDFYDPLPLDGRKYFYSLLLGGRIPSEVLSIRLLDFNKIGFVMGPNPAREQVALRWQNEAEQLHYITLLSAHGQPLFNWEQHGSESELRLPALPAGIYFIHLRNSSTGAQWQQRLLIQ